VQISCPKATFCAAVDAGDAFTFNGTAWSSSHLVDTEGDGFSSISCRTATSCEAVSRGGWTYSFDGSSWSSPGTISTTGTITSLSCPTTSFCVATDDDGDVSTGS
jgi:hypothetical protein